MRARRPTQVASYLTPRVEETLEAARWAYLSLIGNLRGRPRTPFDCGCAAARKLFVGSVRSPELIAVRGEIDERIERRREERILRSKLTDCIVQLVESIRRWSKDIDIERVRILSVNRFLV